MYAYLDERILKTKKTLAYTLLSMLESTSYSKITVVDLIRNAQIDRGTFYRHYKGKEALLDEVLHYLMEDFKESCQSPLENRKYIYVSKFEVSSLKIFNHVYDQKAYYQKLIIDSAIRLRLKDSMCKQLKGVIQNRLRPSTSMINSELSESFIVNAIIGLIFDWIESGFKYSPEYMSNQLFLIINQSHLETLYTI